MVRVFRVFPCCYFSENTSEIVGNGDGNLIIVSDSNTATDVDMLQFDSFFRQLVEEIDQFVQRLKKWRIVQQLGTDMTINTGYFDVGHTGSFFIAGKCFFVRNAEFVFFQSCRNIRVCFGIDIRVDPE